MSKEIAHITDLQPDPQNANLGTERGMAMLDYSLEEYGVGRGIVADKNGLVIGGNKTREQAAAKGIDIIPVHTDGTKLVVTIRDDLDLTTDPKAKGLALADNRVNEVNLAFDPVRLEEYQDELDLSQLWNDEEWEKWITPPFPFHSAAETRDNPNDDQEGPPSGPSSVSSASDQPRIPLSIVLNTVQARQWREYKESVDKTTDTAAFLVLLESLT